MSEYITNREKRLESLLELSLGVMNGENVRELIDLNREAIDNMTPYDMVSLEDRQIRMGISTAEIKQSIDKVINIFFGSLKNYSWKKPPEESFLYYLMLENRMFEFKLNKVKKILKSYKERDGVGRKEIFSELLFHFEEYPVFDAHYVKKENILFPVLEKKWEHSRTLKVMWSLHDDIRKKLKEILTLLKSEQPEWLTVAREIGAYYYLVFGMIQKEELVLFPIAWETFKEEDWESMHLQSFEYLFPFIEIPHKPLKKSTIEESSDVRHNDMNGDELFQSITGNLNREQIELVMNTLPLDMTLVDENNKVVYFSNGKERFFPRSPAIIGRDVKNCHPPESVHIVEKIVEAFRNKEKDRADFSIKMKGHYIVIQYFALRDEKGVYKGVLEVSQDIQAFKEMEGEKRLLDWE
jgi:DUF438 domain-containing protein